MSLAGLLNDGSFSVRSSPAKIDLARSPDSAHNALMTSATNRAPTLPPSVVAKAIPCPAPQFDDESCEVELVECWYCDGTGYRVVSESSYWAPGESRECPVCEGRGAS